MWTKLDDGAAWNPKLLSVPCEARWMWIAGLCYCSRYGTDGIIKRTSVPSLITEPNCFEFASRLVEANLWELVDDDTFCVHDYLKYNPTAERREATSVVRSEIGKLGGIRSGEARRKQIASGLVEANAKQNRTRPVPSRPVLEDSLSPLFVGIWSAYPKKVGRPAAIRAFNALHASEELCATITADITRRLQSSEWSKDNGQFIPNPATYLNQRRWEDQGVDVGLFKSESGGNGHKPGANYDPLSGGVRPKAPSMLTAEEIARASGH